MFYRQKSRVQWLKEGDRNTRFFHSTVNKRQLTNRILSIQSGNGVISEPSLIQKHFIDHFQELLTKLPPHSPPSLEEIRAVLHTRVSPDQAFLLCKGVDVDEIKATMFSLANGKAPGPDGFNADFFKHSWSIVGPLVLDAIQGFFSSGKLLNEVNSTIIALVPKQVNASTVHDFRPISCCNTLYKCIAKILANRLASVLPSIISPSQGAFVKGRRIGDNILLAQELFARFHLPTYSAKCVLKIDFQKAYDTVSWDFLRVTLHALDFPSVFIAQVMASVTSPKFSISINGGLHGYFASRRGLRQGDPLSAYLFTIVMEVFTGLVNMYSSHPDFKFYWRCKATRLSHLFFADDVLLFSQADLPSVTLLKEGILRFSLWSGLSPNPAKSELFLAGVSQEQSVEFLSLLGYRRGSFPVKYLGLPILTSRLTKADCTTLVNAITAKVRSWTHRLLSQAGRLLLVKSVLYAIHVYWATVFPLPLGVINEIEKTLRQFLWKGSSLGTGGAKVSWADVCLPMKEGGLGIRRLRDWNKAALYRHIWLLFTDMEALWCRWIHSTFLKTSNFWVASKPTVCSWTWRKILDVRPDTHLLFKWKVGTGERISFWYDNWHGLGPLYKLFSAQDIRDSGFSRASTVSDFIRTPRRHSRLLTTLLLSGHPFPVTTSLQDGFVWLPHSSLEFSTSSAWDHIRVERMVVPWFSFVWDSAIPPRYQFHLWIITKCRLPTQVLLLSYGRLETASCAFCSLRPDSINHLFFGCSHTASFFSYWMAKCNLAWPSSIWSDSFDRAIRCLSGDSFAKKISRFSFAALPYIIWKERNNVLFRSKVFCLSSLKNRLHKAVKDYGMRFTRIPDTPTNRRLQRNWDLPPSLFG